MLEGLVAAEVLDSVIVAHAQTQQTQVALDHVTGAHAQRGGEAAVDAVDASDLEALPDDGYKVNRVKNPLGARSIGR